MFDYHTYKVLHLLGVFMTVTALGGVIMHAINGGAKDHSWRKAASMTHGIGLLIALVGGFGLLARLGIGWPWPGWTFVKLVIWLVLGAMAGVAMRKPEQGKLLWVLTILFAVLGAYMAINKPF